MKKLFLLLLIISLIGGCQLRPKNEVTFKEISLDYPSWAGKRLDFQVWAVEPSNYFNFAFTNLQEEYWSVNISDGSGEDLYAYFKRDLFYGKKDDILSFNQTKITIDAKIIGYRGFSGKGPLRYGNSLLLVFSYKKGWK